MAESGVEDAETPLDGVARFPATRDWLHHANKSLARLSNVQKSSYHLGGGPREREVNCQCNYRSKHKSSFLSLEAEPPRLTRDSQETASMPDLSVPEILRQFNERQSQTTKQRRRPYSSTVYSTKDKAKKGNSLEGKSSHDHNSFISIKGQLVSPQSRPPPGTAPAVGSRVDDTGYKGLVHLDKRQLEQDRQATLAGLRKYSAAFGDDDGAPSPVPPPPRASPEPTSPRRNSREFPDSAEGSFSEEDDSDEHDDQINKTSESPSESSDATRGSRSLVFAIPTAGSCVGSDDDEISSDFPIGRLSADYVAESDAFLNELAEKRQTEANEISDLLHDMESAKEKLDELHFSSRDVEVESVPIRNPGHDITETLAQIADAKPSLHGVNMPLEQTSVGEKEANRSVYDAFWVEEPISSCAPNSLSLKAGRSCSARFLSQHSSRPARVGKHRSESAIVLRGKTVEFFDADELAAKNRLSDLRRTSESGNGVEPESRKMGTKPPLPRSPVSKNSGKQSVKGKHPTEVVKTNGNAAAEANRRRRKSNLKKSSSDGNIPQTVANSELSQSDTDATKKCVTFSEDVHSQDGRGAKVNAVCTSCVSRENPPWDTNGLDTALNQTREPCSWLNPGVVIQNGLEMKEPLSETQDTFHAAAILEPEKAERPPKANRSTKAKILAKVKEHPSDEEPCTCRTVTRPTAAVLEEARNGTTGAEEAFLVSSTKREKLLEQRRTRPISAPMKRSEGGVESVKRPRSPRRPRAMSATVQTKKSGSEGTQSRPRPSSAHFGRISSKDARRSRAAAKVLKEGYLFKEKPPRPLPPGVKQIKKTRQDEDKRNNNNSGRFISSHNEEEIAASEECQKVFSRLQEKGIDISMETLKRGLMAPARRADELSLASMGSSSGLLSRPENWLPEEYARVKIWKDVLKHAN